MIRERSIQEPSELVIWTASGLLGALLGLGLAFMLWSQLHHTGEPGLLNAAVFTLGLGFGLVGLALESFTTRVFLVALCAVLLIGYFTLGGAFAGLGG